MKAHKQPRKFDCSTCREYKTCKKLCDKAQKYAQQDFVYLKEIPNPSPEGGTPWATIEESRPTMTEREIVVSALLLCKISHKTIRNVLKIHGASYKSMLRRLKKKTGKIG